MSVTWGSMSQDSYGDDEYYDYLDIDCTSCGIKFFVNPLTLDQKKAGKEYPTKCGRCQWSCSIVGILDIFITEYVCCV